MLFFTKIKYYYLFCPSQLHFAVLQSIVLFQQALVAQQVILDRL